MFIGVHSSIARLERAPFSSFRLLECTNTLRIPSNDENSVQWNYSVMLSGNGYSFISRATTIFFKSSEVLKCNECICK